MRSKTMDERLSRIRRERSTGHASVPPRLAVAGTLLCCMCASAQVDAITPPTGQPPKGFRASVLNISSETQHITVPLNRGTIIETTIETSRVDVVASHIADVQPVSPTQLLVTGKAYGRTDVILWDKNEQQYVLDVTVELDLDRLSEVLQKIDRQASVEVRSVMGNIVLTGTVTSAEHAQRMEELAILFLPPRQKMR